MCTDLLSHLIKPLKHRMPHVPHFRLPLQPPNNPAIQLRLPKLHMTIHTIPPNKTTKQLAIHALAQRGMMMRFLRPRTCHT